MSDALNALLALKNDRRGVTAIEYGMIAALISVVYHCHHHHDRYQAGDRLHYDFGRPLRRHPWGGKRRPRVFFGAFGMILQHAVSLAAFALLALAAVLGTFAIRKNPQFALPRGLRASPCCSAVFPEACRWRCSRR